MRTSLRVLCLKYFNRIVQEFIQTFVVDGSLYEKHFVNTQALQEWETAKQNQPLLPNGRYPCRFPGCPSSFKHDGVHRTWHELSHDPPPIVPQEPVLVNTVPNPTDQNPEPKDDVYDYHCGFMNMALLLTNFAHATKEGDGESIIRCIKMFLLHFKQDGSGSTKYTLEALYHLFQVFVLLSPREAERLIWNRAVNNKGCSGCNVAIRTWQPLSKGYDSGFGSKHNARKCEQNMQGFFCPKIILTMLWPRTESQKDFRWSFKEINQRRFQEGDKIPSRGECLWETRTSWPHVLISWLPERLFAVAGFQKCFLIDQWSQTKCQTWQKASLIIVWTDALYCNDINVDSPD